MRQQITTGATLGDLIVGVTDEVSPYIHDSVTLYRIVSLIVSDLLARGIVQLHEHSCDLFADEDLIPDEMGRRFG